jgi:hypothetical protein
MKKHKLGSGIGYGYRRMAVEHLERRSMLAGNVTAFVDGGNLIVRGDNRDNGVLISQTGDGKYAVTGFDFGSGATNINGSADGTLLFTGVTGDINVDLRKGNDALGIGNSPEDLEALAENCGFGVGLGIGSGSGDGSGSASSPGNEAIIAQQFEGDKLIVPRNLIVVTGDGSDGVSVIADVEGFALITTGNGNDGVAVGNVGESSDSHFGDDLIILTGNGNDDACATLVTVHDHLNIQTGNGDDVVSAIGFDAGHALVITGNGSDGVTLSQFDTDREVVVDTGNGNDAAFLSNFSSGQGFGPNEQSGAGFITVVTGNGNDEAELSNFEADGVVVDTGAGNDGSPRGESPITVADATITADLTVVTAGGNDLVLVTNVAVRNVVVNTGAGNDSVEVLGTGISEEVTPTEIRNLTVNTGAGNDRATLDDLIVRNNLFAFLGAGNDFLSANNDQIGGNLLIDAGAGNDNVSLFSSHVGGDATILMGAGNDTLTIAGSDGDGRLNVFGGPGKDTFNNDLGIDSNGSEGNVTVREFEFFGPPEV